MEVEKEHAEGIEDNKGTQDNEQITEAYQMSLGNDNDNGNGVIVTVFIHGKSSSKD